MANLEQTVTVQRSDSLQEIGDIRQRQLDLENNLYALQEQLHTIKNNIVDLKTISCNNEKNSLDSDGVDLKFEDIFSRRKLYKIIQPYIRREIADFESEFQKKFQQLIADNVRSEVQKYIKTIIPENAKQSYHSEDKHSSFKHRSTHDSSRKSDNDEGSFQSDGEHQQKFGIRHLWNSLIKLSTKVENITTYLEQEVKILNTKTSNLETNLEGTASSIVSASIRSELKKVNHSLEVLADRYHSLERQTRNVTSANVNYLIDSKVEDMKYNIVNQLTHDSSPLKSELHTKIEEVRRTQRAIRENQTDEFHIINSKLSAVMQQVESLNLTMLQNRTESTLSQKVKDTIDSIGELKRSLPILENHKVNIFNLTFSVDSLSKTISNIESKINRLSNNETQTFNVIDTLDKRLQDLVDKVMVIELQDWKPYNFSHSDYRNGCAQGPMYVKMAPSAYRNLFVGVVLCNTTRYKIFLSNDVDGDFLDVGDMVGLGQDHCEFVGASKSGETGMTSFMYRTITGQWCVCVGGGG